VGGDGTVNECSKALIGTNVALAIIPIGSGNGFAYHFNIKRDFIKALKQFNNNIIKLIDSCSVNNHPFVNVAGIGFDAHIAKLFAKSKTRGFINYLKLCIKELSYKAEHYTITINNNETKLYAFAIVFANASQYGNDAMISPLSDVQDGLLDIVVIKKFPNWKIPFFILEVLKGKTHLSKFVEIIKTKEIEIKAVKPFVHVDGEVKELSNPIKVKIQEKKLKIFVPNEK